MLYLNTTVRGYPQGLRAGSDPREPIIAIDKGFEKVCYNQFLFIKDVKHYFVMLGIL